eukprot:14639534-Alexandrium_andersonii.AAC.1
MLASSINAGATRLLEFRCLGFGGRLNRPELSRRRGIASPVAKAQHSACIAHSTKRTEDAQASPPCPLSAQQTQRT